MAVFVYSEMYKINFFIKKYKLYQYYNIKFSLL